MDILRRRDGEEHFVYVGLTDCGLELICVNLHDPHRRKMLV